MVELNKTVLSGYGVGCANHDIDNAACQPRQVCWSQIPIPKSCEDSWCLRSWCYVDPQNCQVEHQNSSLRVGVALSFAACGHLPQLTFEDRYSRLENRTFKVALNHNTGGWRGAYHPSEQSFATDNKFWHGPMVEFMQESAKDGGYSLEITRPPEWLKNESEKFFGNSEFGYCVYATALGYLDLCIADYTISAERAAMTPFFETSSVPIYLVVFVTPDDEGAWQAFFQNFRTIFLPFTRGSWLLILFGCLPLLGVIMFFHEKDIPGSAFPNEYNAHLTNRTTQEVTVEARKIALWKQLLKSYYMSFLGFWSGGYDVAALSEGGKVHLLAVSSFLALVLAVYTANLAAILTTAKLKNSVDSLEEALAQDYRFCATRTVAQLVSEIHDFDASERILPDPLSEGGDGLPGFSCPGCASGKRILDFMDENPGDVSLYCHAALVELGDIEIFHRDGKHCNKSIVGDILAQSISGFPINSEIAPELTAWLYDAKFLGKLAEKYEEEEPESKCESVEAEVQEEGVGLTIPQLSGIFIITAIFTIAGLVAKALKDLQTRRLNAGDVTVEKDIMIDQWGGIVDNPNQEESDDQSKTPLSGLNQPRPEEVQE